MATKLFPGTTQLNGIGAGYYDLLTAAGSGTSVTNSTASGTDIQCTTTAGGTAMNFVSPPVPTGGDFTLTTTDIQINALESAMANNVGGRYRMFHRSAGGTETAIGGPFDDGTEFGTVSTNMAWAGDVTNTAFAAGDRLLLKIYITAAGGTMAAGTNTITFGANTFLNIAETVAFPATWFDLTAFRFYEQGTEAAAVATAAQNTNVEEDGDIFDAGHLRVRIQSTTFGGAATDDWKLQYSKNGSSTWVDLSAAQEVFAFTGVGGLTDQAATTNRLTGGTGSFVAGKQESADGTNQDINLTANNFTELVYGWMISPDLPFAVQEGDTYDFRVLYNGAPITYTVTPRFTTRRQGLSQDAFRFYNDNEPTPGADTSSTAIAAQNTNIVHNTTSTPNFHLRFRVQENNNFEGDGTILKALKLHVSKNGAAYAAALSSEFTVTGSGSTLVDGAATTNRMGAGVSGSFDAGVQLEGGITTNNRWYNALNYTEHVIAITAQADAKVNDVTWDFRLLDDTNRFFLVYNQTPRLTVTGGSSGPLSVTAEFDGTGSLSAAMRLRMDVDAAFSGAGSVSASFRQVMRASATFGGVGALSGALAQRMRLDTDFDGTGVLSAALRQRMDIDAIFGGAGSLSADLTHVPGAVGAVHDLAAEFDGIGLLSADLQKTKTLSATFGGVGTLSADLQKTKTLSAAFFGAGALSAELDQAMALSAAFSGTGSLSADLRKAALSLSATFAGAGSLSATLRQNMDVDASFAGAGALSADAKKGAISLAATFAGVGSLTAAFGQVVPLRATYSGVGGLSVPIAQNMALSALLQGAGDLSASLNVPGIVNNWDFQAQFSGSGTMTADMRQRMVLSATYGGAGAFSATLNQRFLVASVFAGAGSLSVDVQKAALQVAATFGGVGGLSATVGQSHSLSAVFNGVGVLSADARKGALDLSATFSGVGSFSADARRVLFINATFGGLGSLSAAMLQQMALRATLSGTGALSASISRVISVTASFSGTGTFSTAITQQMLVSASFLGSSDLFADLTRVTAAGTIWSFPTVLEGEGTLSGALRQSMTVRATYGGLGSFSADIRKVLPTLSSTFAGIGTLSAALRIERGLTASFGGVGSLSTLARVRMAYSVAFTGTGTMLVVVGQRHALSARFDGQGDLRADPFTHLAGAQPFEAYLAGEGTLACDMQLIAHQVIPTYDFPIGRSLSSDYGIRGDKLGRHRYIIGRR